MANKRTIKAFDVIQTIIPTILLVILLFLNLLGVIPKDDVTITTKGKGNEAIIANQEEIGNIINQIPAEWLYTSVLLALSIQICISLFNILRIPDIEKNVFVVNERLKEFIENDRKISIVTGIKNMTYLFDGFAGKYYVCNAPFNFETIDTGVQIDIHKKRYESKELVEAHYYYPVFAHPDQDMVKVWIRNIYRFYNELAKVMKDESARDKVRFHVPPRNGYIFDEKSILSYYLGEKYGIRQCITYIHSKTFMDNFIPTSVVILYDNNKIDEVEHYLNVCAQNMGPEIRGVDSLLAYLETEYSEVIKKEFSNALPS